jgi:hypothetical protein
MKNVMMFNDEDIEDMAKQVESENANSDDTEEDF